MKPEIFTRADLRPMQIEVIDKIKAKKKCGCFLRMGYGKTVSTLTAISDMMENYEVSNILVIAPKRVAELVWKQEAAKWEHLQHLKIEVCTGTAKQKIAGFKKQADIHVTNIETVPMLIENYKFKWDGLVIDESTLVKSHKTARFKKLRRIIKNLDFTVLLSGTPTPEGLHGLWSQMFLIDSGKRLGRNITTYRKRWFELDYWGHTYIAKDGAFDEVMKIVDDVCFTSSYKIDKVDVIPVIHKVRLEPKILEKYKELEKNFTLELEGAGSLDLFDIEADTTTGLHNKLRQFTSGFMYDRSKTVHKIHNAKIEALKEIVEDNPGENFLIAYNFIEDKKVILDNFKDFELISGASEQLERWDNRKIRGLVGHPKSVGHGLNLQRGGSVLVWYGLTWSLEQYLQMNERLPRPGQKDTVRIIHLVAEDTIDEDVANVINGKNITQEKFMHRLYVSSLKRRERLSNSG